MIASFVHIAGGFALAVGLGFGAAWWLLPAPLRRFALLVAPGAGYALFSLATVTISAGLHIAATAAIWGALAILATASAAALVAAARGGGLREAWIAARPAAAATALMAAMVFWPVIVQGTSLYLGTANIDFYQSLAFQEILARHGLAALDPRPAIDYSFDPFFGTFPDPIPAKFGGVMFSLLLQKVLAIEPRASLMTAVVVFLLALPAATYLFPDAVVETGRRVASLAAMLIAVSAPVTMSFIHVLVGQNSALALLPLALAACYLAVRTRDWRAMVLAFLFLDAVFWMYVAILPYIAAPAGIYALYDLARNRRGALRWALLAAAILAFGFAALHAGTALQTRQLVGDMVSLVGRANRSVYVDFLTETALPHSLGLSSYPVTSSALVARAPVGSLVALAGVFVALSLGVLLFYFTSVAAWARRAAPEPRAFVTVTLGVYLAVWLYFNFVSLYGYAIFKMAAWLQFLFVPFVAYGLVTFAREARGPRRFLAVAAGGLVVVANVVSTVDFDVKGLGRDRLHGSVVNSYGIGGNEDYPRLEAALARTLPRGSTVAIAMPDFIANLWAAYYVERAGMKAALVSHDDFPDEDAALPDVSTGRVVNSAGQEIVYKPRYHAERPPYLLLEGPGNLNREITAPPAASALWSSDSFSLVDTSRARDLLVTGRGFYRLEYFDRARYAWWWPDRMRWSAEGGEFLLINAGDPGAEHRFSVVLVAGKDRGRARHVDFYLNGAQFDEAVVHGAARIVTRPFRPTGGIDKIVLKVRERVELTPRDFGLWNRHIATDQRHLNVLVTQARVQSGAQAAPPVAVPASLSARDLIDRSATFDGISLDGWIAPTAAAELALEAPARTVALRIEVPGWAGYRFPLKLRAELDGAAFEREIAAPGEQRIELDAGAASRLVLRLQSAQSTNVPGAGAGSFLLRSLEVR